MKRTRTVVMHKTYESILHFSDAEVAALRVLRQAWSKAGAKARASTKTRGENAWNLTVQSRTAHELERKGCAKSSLRDDERHTLEFAITVRGLDALKKLEHDPVNIFDKPGQHTRSVR